MAKRNFTAGEVLTASNVNTYLSESKNLLINGDFTINQRNFTSITSGAYCFDRWYTQHGTGTITASAQAFTAGDGPTDYQPVNFFRMVTSGMSGTGAFALVSQKVEDVRNLAGQTATISFWAKAGSGTPAISVEFEQGFGTGGSPSATVNTIGVNKITLTGSTAWTRYSATVSIPSITGKTIGTALNTSSLTVNFWVSAGTNFNARTGSLGIQSNTFDIWGVQLEEGSTATPFSRATPTLQSELAACQRYYYRQGGENAVQVFTPAGYADQTTTAIFNIVLPVRMRTAPTSLEFSTLWASSGPSNTAITNLTFLSSTSSTLARVYGTVAGGLTAFRSYELLAANSTAGFVAVSAEL